MCYFILKFKLFISLLSIIESKRPSRCGFDNSPLTTVHEGNSTLETYPWLGTMYYPSSFGAYDRFTTVVLITTQIVLASAADVDAIPKKSFRERAKVYIGHNCSGPAIGILEYNFHPDYAEYSYSSLAIVQLDPATYSIHHKLRPICAPPEKYSSSHFYAATLSDDADECALFTELCSSEIRLHKMDYVNTDECREYYRRTELDISTMWPRHVACARAESGGECVWRSGAVLMMRRGNRWSLVGFGVYGPGCEAPARFLDYGMHHHWVRKSVSRIGYPAITRVNSNYVILRRSATKIQKFGECDISETRTELYNDKITFHTTVPTAETGKERPVFYKRVRYNFTLFENIDYSCATFRTTSDIQIHEQLLNEPILALRHWCRSTEIICYEYANLVQMAFYVEVIFMRSAELHFRVYGKPFVGRDIKGLLKYMNRVSGVYRGPIPAKYKASPKDTIIT